MKSASRESIMGLMTPEAVRKRCGELFTLAGTNDLKHFTVDMSRLGRTTSFVIEEIEKNYPSGVVPFHSRWRHFEFGTKNLWLEVLSSLSSINSEELVRRRLDLAVVSVLLDAGAGPEWVYKDLKTGLVLGRSEGLALASIRFVESGFLSIGGLDDPVRVDSAALRALKPEVLANAFQVTKKNWLIGIEERATLLNRLGKALEDNPEFFSRNGEYRPGYLYDYLLEKADGKKLRAREILLAILNGLGTIWPEGLMIESHPVGDAGYHPGVFRQDITNNIVPFHKLSQWMTYSLIEPLEDGGLTVVNLDELTGLAEYRNGGLFLDTGVLALKDIEAQNKVHPLKSDLVVEWRALTIVLLDKLAAKIRKHTGNDSKSLPLVSVLQGGTWSAGRRIARKQRGDGRPPLKLYSVGTIF